jgi:hypothetical protein
MTSNDTSGGQGGHRSTNDPEGMGGADTGAGTGTLGGTGTSDLGGTGSGAGMGGLGSTGDPGGASDLGGEGIAGTEAGDLTGTESPEPAGLATSATRPATSDGRGRSPTPTQFPDP